ncbi:hypothetical protein ACFL04_02135 [Patescibacteria group bacterium]
MKADLKVKKGTILFVLALYIIATLALTYPLIKDATEKVPGQPGDVHNVLAIILNKISDYQAQGQLSGFFADIGSLKLGTNQLYSYFSLIFDVPLGYNIFWLLSFILAGLGTYLLTRFVILNTFKDTIKNRIYQLELPAILAGFIFAFNPAHLAWSMGFSGATHIQWIPFTTLFLLKTIHHQKLKYLFYTLIFFILLIYGEPHFAVFYIIFLIPLLSFYIYRNPSILYNKQIKKWLIIIAIVAVIIFLYSYRNLFQIVFSDNNYLQVPLDQISAYSNDALSSIVPPKLSAIFGDTFSGIRASFTGNTAENSGYLGLGLIILVMISLFKKYKEPLFWGFTGIGFYILSLGPFLHISGILSPKIPMPYLLFPTLVPFFNNIRSVNRLDIISYLALAIAAAFGISYLLRRIDSNKIKNAVAGLFIIIIGVEYFVVPLPTTSLEYPAFYDQLLSEPDDYSIIEIPSSTSYTYETQSRYRQAIHHKDVIGGLDFARKTPDKYNQQKNTPIIRELLYLLPVGKSVNDVISYDYRQLSKTIFKQWKIKYVTLSKEYIGQGPYEILPENFIMLKKFITEVLSLPTEYEDDKLIAYRVPEYQGTSESYISVANESNWSQPTEDTSARNLDNGGEIIINNSGETTKDFTVQMTTSNNEPLLVYHEIDEKFIGRTFYAWPELNILSLPLDNLAPGQHTIRINIRNARNPSKSNDMKVTSLSLIDDSFISTDKYPHGQELKEITPTAYYFNNFNIPRLSEAIPGLTDWPEIYGFPLWQQLITGSINPDLWLQAQDFYSEDYYKQTIQSAASLFDQQTLTIDSTKLRQAYITFMQKFANTWGSLKLKRITGGDYSLVFTATDFTTPLPVLGESQWRKISHTSNGIAERELKGDSSIYLYSTDNSDDYTLEFTLRGLLPLTELNIDLNGTNILSKNITIEEEIVTLILPSIKSGWNDLNFKVVQSGEELITRESERGIGVYISNVSISK